MSPDLNVRTKLGAFRLTDSRFTRIPARNFMLLCKIFKS